MRLMLAACIVSGGQAASANDAYRAVPISRPIPQPQNTPVDGLVTVGFDIGPNGRVTRATVVTSSPPGQYDEPALEAVKNWRYAPAHAGGMAVAQYGNSVALHFEAADKDPATAGLTPMFDLPAEYPRAAYAASVQGWATVAFTVNELGLVDAAKVTSSSPSGVFDEAALDAVKGRHYVPLVRDGRPVRVDKIVETIAFDLAHAQIAPTRIGIPKLAYPPLAQELGIEGSCSMRIAIGDDGHPTGVNILASTPTNIFDASCRSAGFGFVFKPPVDEHFAKVMRVHIVNVNFRLGPHGQTGAITFAPGHWVRLRFDLLPSGAVSNCQVVDGTVSPRQMREARDALADQRFTPARPGQDTQSRKNLIRTFLQPSLPPTL